jgi:hypothetical protein
VADPKDPFYFVISDIHEYDYFYCDGDKLLMGDQYVTPIPLYDLVLLKLGFIKGEIKNEYEIIFEQSDEKIRLVATEAEYGIDSIRVNIYAKDGPKPEFYFQGRILYLHELQNAYNLLTNRELSTDQFLGNDPENLSPINDDDDEPFYLESVDLRIGNMVLWNGSETREPEHVYVVDITLEEFKVLVDGSRVDESEVEPSQIEEELLEKLGFTETNPGEEYERVCNDEKGSVRITIIEMEPWYKKISFCREFKDGSKREGSLFSDITFLHQLQNAYFFCLGEDMDVSGLERQTPYLHLN